jgi:hypothetical protein
MQPEVTFVAVTHSYNGIIGHKVRIEKIKEG